MLTIAQQRLCGLNSGHLQTLGSHRIHPQAAQAFINMQAAAQHSGVNLQIASGFRDYHRQAAIWQHKVAASSQNTDADLHRILRWSAIPGASRHHWGTDMDVYDPDTLGTAKLTLEPWEYAPGGHQNTLYLWLQANAHRFGFYWPYAEDRGGVAIEPWHLSYAPVSTALTKSINAKTLCKVWQQYPPAAHSWLEKHCTELLTRYVYNITQPGQDVLLK